MAFKTQGCSLTSDLLLQVEYDGHSLMEDKQFCLRLLTLQVQLAHATQLLEGLVDVSHPQALPGVVGHPSLTLTLGFLFWIQILVFGDTAVETISSNTWSIDLWNWSHIHKQHIMKARVRAGRFWMKLSLTKLDNGINYIKYLIFFLNKKAYQCIHWEYSATERHCKSSLCLVK